MGTARRAARIGMGTARRTGSIGEGRNLPATRSPSDARRPAIAANLVAVLCWAIAPVMLKAVTGSFSVAFQNFWRYLVSLVVLWPVYLATADRSRLAADLADARAAWWRIGLIALVQYAFQVSWMWGVFLLYPGLMSLLGQTQVLFGLLLALALFPDERAVVRRPLFIGGVVMAIAGVLLVTLGRAARGTVGYGVGVAVVLASSLSWALLGALIRAWVPHLPPLLTVSSVFTILTPLFLITWVGSGGGSILPPAPARHWLLLVGSGLIGIVLGQSLFYWAVPILGVATSTSLNLLGPLVAVLLSWLIFGETLEVRQIIGAVLLVAGSWFIIRLRPFP